MLHAGDVIAVYTYRFGKLTLFNFQFFSLLCDSPPQFLFIRRVIEQVTVVGKDRILVRFVGGFEVEGRVET